jgi:hypothetical protein
MNTNFKKKAWISFAIIFVSIIAATGAIYYFSGDLAFQSGTVISDSQTVADQNNALSNFALLKGEASAAESYEAAISQLLPDQYGVITFSTWLASIAKKYGSTISSNMTGAAVAPVGSQPGTIAFSFTLQGPNGSAAAFLKDIEKQEAGFLFEINTFNFTNTNSGEELDAQGTLFFR